MKKTFLTALTGLALAGALFVAIRTSSAQGRETPITIGDGGSIIIQIPGTDHKMDEFKGADNASLAHPDKGEMGCIVVTRGTQVIKRDKCKKGRPCAVNFLSAGDPAFGDVHVSVGGRDGQMSVRDRKSVV